MHAHCTPSVIGLQQNIKVACNYLKITLGTDLILGFEQSTSYVKWRNLRNYEY